MDQVYADAETVFNDKEYEVPVVDGCNADCQNSGTVARFLAEEIEKRASDLGYETNPVPTEAELSPDLPLPGYSGDPYADLTEAGSDPDNFFEAVGDFFVDAGNAIVDFGKEVARGFSEAVDSFGEATGWWPVVLDLDGDGIELSATKQTYFDLDGDGYRERTTWAAPDDAFLVIDLNANGSIGNGDGKIDQAKELAFSEWTPNNDFSTDLQSLAWAFDKNRGGNNDGKLTWKDDIWRSLKVWQDQDQDGEVDNGELKTLGAHGITRIDLGYDDGSHYWDRGDDISFLGNTLHGFASFWKGDTRYEGGVGDVALNYDGNGWRETITNNEHTIEFESGETFRFYMMDGTGSANLNVNALNLDHVIGDARNNIMDAAGKTRGVAISGGNGNDQIKGGHADDMLSGDAGADSLWGNDGNDLIFFDASDVVVNGGWGNDVAYAVGTAGVSLNLTSNSIETVYGTEANDVFTAVAFADGVSMHGDGGSDTLTGGNADDLLSGGDGNDTLKGGGVGDILIGGAGKDIIKGENGDDTLLGGTSDDTLQGGAGDDLLFGGDGHDTLDSGADDDYVDGGAGHDTLTGGAGDDTLFGNGQDDVLNGGDGDDFLDAGWGDDTVYTGSGDDFVSTGDGRDVVYMQGWGDKRVETGDDNDEIRLDFNYDGQEILGGKGWDKLFLTGKKSDYTVESFQNGNQGKQEFRIIKKTSNQTIHIQDIESIFYSGGTEQKLSGRDTAKDNSSTFRGMAASTDLGVNYGSSTSYFSNGANSTSNRGPGDDYLRSDGVNHAGADNIQMGTGDDTLFLVGGNDIGNGNSGDDSISGDSGSDTINGNSGNDWLDGGTGADTVKGSNGADLIQGGAGSYTLEGGAGADVIYGDAGNDTILAGSGSDIVSGGNGDDKIWGGTGEDRLDGGDGIDTIHGQDGADRINGDAKDDKLYGGYGDDTITGGTGNDTLDGENGNDLLEGDDGNDTLFGRNGSDALYGGAGDDTLHGDGWDDSLFGDSGNDTLNGGSGNDFLEGGAGADKINGQSGVRDVAGYTQSGAAVDINFGANTARGGHAQGDILTDVEGVVGSDFNDKLTGNGSDNQFYGGLGNDELKGWSGRDELHGDDGHDKLWGDGGGDTLWGGAGNDALWGDSSEDTLVGGSGNDNLWGGSHNDHLLGGEGDDYLDGGSNNDELTGGDGADIFRFASWSDDDVITDYHWKDRIEFNIDGLRFQDLTITNSGPDDAVIAYDGGKTITLLNVRAWQLGSEDFDFV